jgi:hypothetical protein
VSFGRQKRLLVGAMALLAPIPLPLSDVIGWPVLVLFEAGVLLFLVRASRDDAGWLPHWAMNALGAAYLPVLGADLLVLHRGHLVAPVLHLCLFTLVVKLFAMVRERDKWQAAIGIFFVFLAAMGTSVHPTIALYLTAFLVLALVMLMRFAFFHVLADFSRGDAGGAGPPLVGLVTVSTVVILLLAVPLFAVLPRLRAPYIVGRGSGSGLVQEAAGFSDAVSLGSIDQIRTSRAVAIRVQFEQGTPVAGEELRFKAATYDRYESGHWQRAPQRGALPRRQGALFVLAPGRPERWLHVWLLPLRSRSLPVPIEALQVEPRVAGIDVDQGGALSFPFSPIELREYRVGIGARPVLLGQAPGGAGAPTLDTSGVTPRMAALAAQVTGRGDAGQRAARLETHLAAHYTYTLDLGGRADGDNPIDSFLFRYQSGQCEYFASAMVLLLRSQGIPARLVTGFLGGEYNPFEGYLIVRDSNAHAWVEAWMGERDGWRVFDPTPPAGRPVESAAGFTLLLRQAWDFVQFRWDRYVLTYGIYDQLAFFGQLRRMWHGVMAIFDRHPQSAAPDQAAVAQAADGRSPAAGAGPALAGWRRWARSPWAVLAALVALLLAGACVLLWRRLRPPEDATWAYGRMRQRLVRAGFAISPALGPLALQAQAARRFPAAAAATGQVIALYVRESFAGRRLSEPELAALRAALATAEAQLRRRQRAAAAAAGSGPAGAGGGPLSAGPRAGAARR